MALQTLPIPSYAPPHMIYAIDDDARDALGDELGGDCDRSFTGRSTNARIIPCNSPFAKH